MELVGDLVLGRRFHKGDYTPIAYHRPYPYNQSRGSVHYDYDRCSERGSQRPNKRYRFDDW